ncbi:MAG TPA: penicillin acylase family protein [Longimicrobiales bacterium]|nr:penicillin acylase family protein [Longimicrobiales bacterium]
MNAPYRITTCLALLAAFALPFTSPTRAQTVTRADAPSGSQDGFTPAEIARWERQAQNVEIIRDRWGIAHVYGRTDADAVFGMEYAQAEDDFNRVEMNYIVALGRLAQAEGESAIWHDLRARLYADPDSLQAAYAASPEPLKKLMDAFADGLNYYLHTHPEVKPRVITRFEPWMALSFTEGSIGGDIERIDLGDLAAFYGGAEAVPPGPSPLLEQAALSPDGPAPEPRGSNGISIAPKNTVNGHSLLYINPHTSFYFRSELQMTSDEGLNAYGAVTWGQFFIYQGFNERAGWMHTSSGVDNIDWFNETPVTRDGRRYYRYGGRDVPMMERRITVPYRTDNGMAERTFTAYFTRHGPIVGRQGEHWLSVSLMWQPVNALTQSYSRTKAQNLTEYLKVMELHTNSSNNTLFADAEGNIAYLHSNYIPRRDPALDWTRPVDGSDPATDYRGVLSLEETPNVINPDVGWVYNANNWPWSAAGPDSPIREDYPAYVETGRWETPRGYHALKLLPGRDDFTMASLTEVGYDSFLPAFEVMVPSLVKAYDALPAGAPPKTALALPMAVLRDWDYRWGVNSVATSLAVFWGEDVLRRVASAARAADTSGEDFIGQGRAEGAVLVDALVSAVERLESDFGTWQTPWGHINRFQRISPEIGPNFDDARPSIPVPFTSARWGSLASFGARPYPNTKKWYGTSGNSFIAVVEFGDSVRARAVSAGGESGDPASPHFDDQAAAYAQGALRDVYFYRRDVEANMERRYSPGQRAP